MQDSNDLPSTETPATPRPPKGENVKDLVTPGDQSDEEAEAEEVAPPGGEMPGADEADPTPGEAPEEEQSPT
jgi:hypothetical protein